MGAGSRGLIMVGVGFVSMNRPSGAHIRGMSAWARAMRTGCAMLGCGSGRPVACGRGTVVRRGGYASRRALTRAAGFPGLLTHRVAARALRPHPGPLSRATTELYVCYHTRSSASSHASSSSSSFEAVWAALGLADPVRAASAPAIKLSRKAFGSPPPHTFPSLTKKPPFQCAGSHNQW